MTARWQSDSCEQVQAYFSVYSVPVAAILWCGVPADEINDVLSQTSEILPGIFSHPYIPCLEPRCRAIHGAIISGSLPASRENGRITSDHIAPNRRHVSRADLKKWILEEFPGDKPAFLFDEIERSAAHPSVTTTDFTALKAAHDFLKSEHEKDQEQIRALTRRLEQRDVEFQQLQQIANLNGNDRRSEMTYLNIIGCLLGLMLGQSPAGKKHSIFENQTAIVELAVANYGQLYGVSERNLCEKFAAANRALNSN